MQTILRKLSSRKLWMAIAGIVAGIAMAFGVDEGAVSTVAGAITAVASVVTYVLAEGKIDAAAAGAAIQDVQDAIDLMTKKEASPVEPD